MNIVNKIIKPQIIRSQFNPIFNWIPIQVQTHKSNTNNVTRVPFPFIEDFKFIGILGDLPKSKKKPLALPEYVQRIIRLIILWEEEKKKKLELIFIRLWSLYDRLLLRLKKYLFILFFRIGRLILSLIFEISETIYDLYIYIYQILSNFFIYFYQILSDIIMFFYNFLFVKSDNTILEKFLKDEVKDEVKKVVKDKIEKIIVPGGVSGCHPINSESATCIDLDIEEKKKRIKNLIFMVINVRKKFGKRSQRQFKYRENWLAFKKVLDKVHHSKPGMKWFDSRYYNITYNHYFFDRHHEFIKALYTFYEVSLGSTNPFLLLLNPINIFYWATENLDKAFIHLLSQIFIIYLNRDFIKDNLTKISTNFLNIVDEILDYENKNYKTHFKNILINIKELLIKVFSFIPFIFYGYILGHLLEPFRVFFLANQELEICLNRCPEEIGPIKFYNSKFYIFMFQYYLKILRFNLFFYRIDEYLEKIGVVKSTSNYYGGSTIIDKVLSVFASIIAPWRLKNLDGFKNGRFSNNQEIYELLLSVENNKYHDRESYQFLKKFIKFFDKDKEDLGIVENRVIESYLNDLYEVTLAGLERYGVLPGDKFNKITEH